MGYHICHNIFSIISYWFQVDIVPYNKIDLARARPRTMALCSRQRLQNMARLEMGIRETNPCLAEIVYSSQGITTAKISSRIRARRQELLDEVIGIQRIGLAAESVEVLVHVV